MAGLKFHQDEYVIASNGFPYSPLGLRKLFKKSESKRRRLGEDELDKALDNLPFNCTFGKAKEFVYAVKNIQSKDLRYTTIMDPNGYLVDDANNLFKAVLTKKMGLWVFQFHDWDEMSPALMLESKNYKFDKESREMLRKTNVTIPKPTVFTGNLAALQNATFGRIGPKNAIFLEDSMW